MGDQQGLGAWRPKPFSVAVLDSDEYVAESLCDLLQKSGLAAAAFNDISSLMQAHEKNLFDAYVLDYLADWLPQSDALEKLIASIRGKPNGDVPVFVLGNQIAPERIERLGNIIMQHEVRYLLKPVRATYLAKRIGEALVKRAGL